MDHRATCGGIWCLDGFPGQPGGVRAATCGRCGLTATSTQAWSQLDPAAYLAARDPFGHGRAAVAALSGAAKSRPPLLSPDATIPGP